jgi:hypothetical protein
MGCLPLTCYRYQVIVIELLRLALSKGPNRVGVSPPHLKTETDPVSETLFSCIYDSG